MPRAKKPTDQDVPDVAPEGMDQASWDLGKKLGNISLAQRLVAVADDGEYPRDAAELSSLIETATDLERKSLKTHMRLRDTIGRKLANSLAEYHTHRKRVSRLTGLLDGVTNQSSSFAELAAVAGSGLGARE